MATFSTHIVNTRLIDIDTAGNVIDQNNPATQIHDVLVTEQVHRVMPDTAVPNSVGHPTIAAYLDLEGAAGYELKHIDQFTIITQITIP